MQEVKSERKPEEVPEKVLSLVNRALLGNDTADNEGDVGKRRVGENGLLFGISPARQYTMPFTQFSYRKKPYMS